MRSKRDWERQLNDCLAALRREAPHGRETLFELSRRCRWTRRELLEYLRHFPLSVFHLIPDSVVPLRGGRVRVGVQRVLPACTRFALGEDGCWRAGVTETDPPIYRLHGVPGNVMTISRLGTQVLSCPARVRRLMVAGVCGEEVPFCLEAGFATSRPRLKAVRIQWLERSPDDRAGRARLEGTDWPLTVVVNVVGPWRITDVRAAKWGEVRRQRRSCVVSSPFTFG